jgi:hypothetical protein
MVSLNASLATQFDKAASQQGSKKPAKKPRTVLCASSGCQEPVEDEDGAAARASRECAPRLTAEAEIRQEAEQRLESETAKREEREAMIESVKAQVSSPIYYLH